MLLRALTVGFEGSTFQADLQHVIPLTRDPTERDGPTVHWCGQSHIGERTL